VAQQRRNWQERFGRTAADRFAEGRHANPRQFSAATSQYLETTRGDPPVLASRTSSSEQPIRAYEVEAQDVAFENLQLVACI